MFTHEAGWWLIEFTGKRQIVEVEGGQFGTTFWTRDHLFPGINYIPIRTNDPRIKWIRKISVE
jgi:hypothetical protein